MLITFIITKTPQEESFNNFLKLLNLYLGREEVFIYLIGNGVYGALHGHIHADLIHTLAQQYEVHAFKGDLKARGLLEKNLIEEIKLFDNYDDFVEFIMEKTDQIFSF